MINLLHNEPDGLGKHIFIQKVVDPHAALTEQEVINLLRLNDIPILLMARQSSGLHNCNYIVIIGSDLCPPLSETPTIFQVADALKKCQHHLDKAFKFLGIDQVQYQKLIMGYDG